MKLIVVPIVTLLLIAILPARATEDALSSAANQALMTANAKKPGVVSLSSGLQYRILRSGFGNRPSLADTVQIEYSARLINGTVFDGSSPGLPVTLLVSNLMRGLNEALQLMHEGDHWELLIPPNLAFGARGAPNGSVPPNQFVIIDLTLVSIIQTARTAGEPDHPSITAMDRQRGLTREQGALLTIPQ
jgi:FKBP-type peptidyl-prolyl cis-trans isomerase